MLQDEILLCTIEVVQSMADSMADGVPLRTGGLQVQVQVVLALMYHFSVFVAVLFQVTVGFDC